MSKTTGTSTAGRTKKKTARRTPAKKVGKKKTTAKTRKPASTAGKKTPASGRAAAAKSKKKATAKKTATGKKTARKQTTKKKATKKKASSRKTTPRKATARKTAARKTTTHTTPIASGAVTATSDTPSPRTPPRTQIRAHAGTQPGVAGETVPAPAEATSHRVEPPAPTPEPLRALASQVNAALTQAGRAASGEDPPVAPGPGLHYASCVKRVRQMTRSVVERIQNWRSAA